MLIINCICLFLQCCLTTQQQSLLYTQEAPALLIGFQGHGVKGHGHAVTTMALQQKLLIADDVTLHKIKI